MQESHWEISTDTKTEAKCRKVLARVLTKLGYPDLEVKYEPYWKTKEYSGRFSLILDCSSKEELMFELIRLGQLIGYYWELYGSIETQTDACSRKSSISGVIMMQWAVDIPDEWR